MTILNQLNWVDILIFAVIVRIIFIAIKRGIVVELFKLSGTLCTVFFTFHYCTGLSNFLREKINFPEGLSDIVSFIFLWTTVTLVFKFVRDGFLLLLKIEAHSLFDRWGSLLISIGRALLVCSLIIVALKITGSDYFVKKTQSSFSGSRLVSIAPDMYESSYDNFISKFFPNEKLNKKILSLAHSRRDKEK